MHTRWSRLTDALKETRARIERRAIAPPALRAGRRGGRAGGRAAHRRGPDDSIGSEADGDRSGLRSRRVLTLSVNIPRTAGRSQRRLRRASGPRRPASSAATAAVRRVRHASCSSASRRARRDVGEPRRATSRSAAAAPPCSTRAEGDTTTDAQTDAARLRRIASRPSSSRRCACRSRPAGRFTTRDATPDGTTVIVSENVDAALLAGPGSDRQAHQDRQRLRRPRRGSRSSASSARLKYRGAAGQPDRRSGSVLPGARPHGAGASLIRTSVDPASVAACRPRRDPPRASVHRRLQRHADARARRGADGAPRRSRRGCSGCSRRPRWCCR